MQKDYEEANMGLEFLYSNRIGFLIANLMIIFMMAPGLPLLYPIGFVMSFLMYWSDKYVFFRLYRKPPLYDGKISKIIPNTIWWSIIGHLYFGYYMYSDSSIFGATTLSLEQAEELGIDVTDGSIDTDSAHMVFYIILGGFLLCLMIIESLTGLIGRLMRILCFCFHFTVNEDEKL